MKFTIANSIFARRARRGLSMIEALFVLGFAVMFLLGALQLFNQANSGNRNRTAIQQLQNIQQAVRTLYASQPDFGSGAGVLVDITQSVVSARNFPQNMLSGNIIRHVYGGVVSVIALGPANLNGQAVNVPTFVVRFSDVPDEACVALMTADTGGGTSGLVGVMSSTALALPATALNPASVIATGGPCANIAGGSRRTLSWRFQ